MALQLILIGLVVIGIIAGLALLVDSWLTR